ncbi:hypothetical protein A7985_22710 [Pseudoalteromonas luteoviolacea]|uniref:3-hydroxyacyl-CoA dehydrogenase n=1 Tax=Pseudoalteromonas luteoviolacea TaxID=43657 RepID=A0A1C0TJY4_9GAMM|nr:SDR family NAD(P)-dependent oxidoreductase [Pseudoalteromonas luteoviolacea]OCQ18830.1 hypothetical protein A7985_22710 [Pseudoalteromonas luteoviolacea]
MINFIEHLVSQVKNKNLAKSDALSLIQQFAEGAEKAKVIHPLLQTNKSNFNKQCYTSTFSGEEFFLKDHQVEVSANSLSKIFPGVCYLEMARAALVDAQELQADDAASGRFVELQNIVWVRPLLVEQKQQAHIELFPVDDTRTDFEIFVIEAEEEVVLCRGTGVLHQTPFKIGESLANVQQRIAGEALSATELYQAYENIGLHYGPAFQAIQGLVKGDKEVLTTLQLPTACQGAGDKYWLHPSMLDGALQSTIGLFDDPAAFTDQPMLPFAVESVKIAAEFTQTMYARLKSDSDISTADNLIKLDLDLYNEQGQCVLQATGFSSRKVAQAATETAPISRLIAKPVWQTLPQVSVQRAQADKTIQQVLLIDAASVFAAPLGSANAHIAVTTVQLEEAEKSSNYIKLASFCFDMIKNVLEAQPDKAVHLQLVCAQQSEHLIEGITGLLASVEAEYPRFRGQLLLIDDISAHNQQAIEFIASGITQPEPILRQQQQQWQQRVWQEQVAVNGNPQQPWRADGVYLILGGLGGVGTVFAQEIAHQVPSATILIAGRAQLEAAQQAKLAQITGKVEYIQLDVTDGAQTTAAIAQIQQQYGQLNGVLQCAGVVDDKLLLNKSLDEFKRVLAPKVEGVYNLDKACQNIELDFFVLFSSIAAMGNVGQSDYACANGFLDHFAAYRNRLLAAGARFGATRSINWPLWQAGGMAPPEHTQQALQNRFGMHPLDPETGIQLFYQALQLNGDNLLVVKGELDKIRTQLLKSEVTQAATVAAEKSDPQPQLGQDEELLSNKVKRYISGHLSKLIKLPLNEIDTTEKLEKYGIDSIVATEITQAFEQDFDTLPKTLFFEYQTIAELAGYFLRDHREKVSAMFDVATSNNATPKPAAAPKPRIVSHSATTREVRAKRNKAPRLAQRQAQQVQYPDDEAIAIVGLSGQYPQSDDLEAYWDNLKNGQDCITEVPEERWRWQDYYTQDRMQRGKHFSKWGGFINGVDEFDPLFFNIAPAEAEAIDPQERLFLQHAWMAVEDAGYTRKKLSEKHPKQNLGGQVGVYVGVMYSEFQLFGAEKSVQGEKQGIASSFSSIANRVSYVLDIHGPSIAMDTMCSSSLTAIHLACQDLKSGRTNLAIAGGVNVTIHPNKYLILSQGQFISTDGHCQSFGVGGDGYIPGEGVGAVVLKRLSEAEAQGNHIYGVICASALNHGGKTNGYTVPNPVAQTDVIKQALSAGKVDPRHVSYLEAHGTGTKLGDPIEISALHRAYNEATEITAASPTCYVGSVKSNIGHGESAAGIAGLTKVLLQMKHGQLVPSLHSRVLNPNIDFSKTNFHVNQTLTPWQRPVVDGKEIPRYAGLSSFGAGGANAHLIIKEHMATAQAHSAHPHQDMVAILLSARTAQQLKQKAHDLVAFLQKPDCADALNTPAFMSNLAYTLQMGREAMDERLAVLVSSGTELVEKLLAYVDGDTDIEYLTCGQAYANKETLSLFNTDENLKEATHKWLQSGKVHRLTELWAKGLEVDWAVMYQDQQPQLLSLPSYPFAKDKFAMPKLTDKPVIAGAGAVLHPLLHANTSDVEQQKFTTLFSGEEYFLAHHQLSLAGAQPVKVLPAVVYLEMAREAVTRSVPASADACHVVLHNSVWLRPLVVTQATEVVTRLAVEDDANYKVEVHSLVNDEWILHFVSDAQLSHATASAAIEAAHFDAASLSHTALYERFSALGIEYGAGFQSISQVGVIDDKPAVKLSLNEAAIDASGQVQLAPGMMDAAFQAIAATAFAKGQRTAKNAYIPYSQGSMTILAPCTAQMIAVLTPHSTTTDGDEYLSLDIDLYQATGECAVQIRGLTLVSLGKSALSASVDPTSVAPTSVDPTGENAILMASPVWQSLSLDAPHDVQPLRRLILSAAPVSDPSAFTTPYTQIEHVPEAVFAQANSAEGYMQLASYVFTRIKTELASSNKDNCMVQLVLGQEHALAMGLASLMRTAMAEEPRFVGQVILSDATTANTQAQLLEQLAAHRHVSLLDATAGEVKGIEWQAQDVTTDAQAYADDGVFLITGGLGGLGKLVAKDILANTDNSTVVLTGRGTRTAQQVAEALALSDEHTARVVYQQVDLEALSQVQACFAAMSGAGKPVTTIIHSAGMVDDAYILNKDEQAFQRVLAPKVIGTHNLDIASKDLELDNFILFSSVSGAFGNPGQADYAAANGFMDQFATYRNQLTQQQRRTGRALSINWPIWQAGGMRIDEGTLAILKEATGIVPLASQTGLAALKSLLSRGTERAIVLQGDTTKLAQMLRTDSPAEVVKPAQNHVSEAVSETLLKQAQRFIAKLLSSTLKIPEKEIKPALPFEHFGIDSVIAMQLTNDLEAQFGDLPKTLFFEYQSTDALAKYFLKQHRTRLEEKLGQSSANNTQRTQPVAHVTAAQAAKPSLQHSAATSRFKTVKSAAAPQPRQIEVAIVGLAGRYPQSDNIEEFWQNLCEGRDCISEIPAERWDHNRFFDAQRGKQGKCYSAWGGFVSDFDKFDPQFFNITPKEAAMLDPQERLFLQTAWETIEDAGYSRERIFGERVGVYVGVMWGQYELYGAQSVLQKETVITGSSYASIANRVSYYFNFSGPSMAVDTMCSSSLTAIHLACKDIQQGEISAAIAGGVNLSVHPYKYLNLSQGNFVSSDGRCRSFGDGGDGYVPGEGVGAILLKPLDVAREQGDHIYAVIKSSHLNHGGKTNGYTVPNPVAQAALIHESLQKGNIAPESINYIEAHGTGTSLGDPIEIRGLQEAFAHAKLDNQTCPIGSVKSNIGHLESAAGIAAVTKSLLQLKHNQIVPSLHAKTLNPNIDFAATPFYVAQTLSPLNESRDQQARVSVSSFGAGGANAHLVLQAYPEDSASGCASSDTPQVFVLSGKDPQALREYVNKYLTWLGQRPQALNFADVIYTAMVGRSAMEERLGVVCSSFDELTEKLHLWLELEANDSSNKEATLASADIFVGNSKAQATAGAVNFIEGDAGMAFLDAVAQNNDVDKLAQLWVSGLDIEWQRYFGEGSKRVSMPTYPFKKEKYWVDVAQHAQLDAAADTAQAASDLPWHTAQEVYFTPQWAQRDITHSAPQVSPATRVLFLNTDKSLQAQILAKLGVSGSVMTVSHDSDSSRFEAEQNTRFTLNCANESQLIELATHLKHTETLPDVIIHQGTAIHLGEHSSALLDTDVRCMLLLCRELMKHAQKALRIVSFSVAQTGMLNAHNTALSGFFRALSAENPRYRAKSLEFIAQSGTVNQALVAQGVAQEVATDDWQSAQLRYTVSATQLQGFQQSLMEYSAPRADQGALALRQSGVYLITGGLGGLGYAVAQYLAEQVRANLILLGRSPLCADKQRKITALNRLGARVEYVQADIADKASLAAGLQQLPADFAHINGVFHSAGVSKDAFIYRKSVSQISAVVAPKLTGTLNLDTLLKDQDLDMFVLFSSVSAVTGNPGQSDYGYANCFLDTFAQSRTALVTEGQRRGKTLSINWPYWQAGGMQLSEDKTTASYAQTGMLPIPTDVGIAMLSQLLNSAPEQVIPLYGAADKLKQHVLAMASSQPIKAHSGGQKASRSKGNAKAQLTELLKQLISAETNLSIERIDSRESFESFGIDSVIIGKINHSLEQHLGELPQTLLYEYDNVDALTDHLLVEFNAASLLAEQTEVVNEDEVDYEMQFPEMQNEEDTSSLDTADAMVTEPSDAAQADTRVAIIGMHGIYAGSDDLNGYWQSLIAGEESIALVPAERWDYETFYDAAPEKAADGKIYCKWGGFLSSYNLFDAERFNISAHEANIIDPQERLFLLSVFSTLEDAGYTKESIKRASGVDKQASVGVFVGVTSNTYQLLASDEWNKGNAVSPASLPWSIANRVSYYFDFKGPSMPIDTACSSSLVAIDYACQSLLSGGCDMAIAGGVNLYLHPAKYHSLCVRRMLSGDGKCASYGVGDDGFIPSEGVGSILLKPLDKAVQDGDHIHGIVRASAHAHSGRSNGYSAPNPNSQAELITRTLELGALHPEEVSYIEGHGTGTTLGDSLEVVALSKAFKKHSKQKQFCAIGSVKANVGHSESAAGIAGVTKVLLQMKHRQLAPSINSAQINPNIEFEHTPFYLQTTPSEWQVANGGPRIALVNSFGAGGVNACVAIEEFIASDAPVAETVAHPLLFVLSARNKALLATAVTQYAEYLQRQQDVDLDSLCYTLQIGREEQDERLAIVFSSQQELVTSLQRVAQGQTCDNAVMATLPDTRKVQASLARDNGEALSAALLERVAAAWTAGTQVVWLSLYEESAPQKMSLPTSPFDLQPYWVSQPDATEQSLAAPVKSVAQQNTAEPVAAPEPTESEDEQFHPLIESSFPTSQGAEFVSKLSKELAFVKDHQVNGHAIFPGAGLLEIAYMSGSLLSDKPLYKLSDVVFSMPVDVRGEHKTIHTAFINGGSANYPSKEFEVASADDMGVHCEGVVHYSDSGENTDEGNYLAQINAIINNHESRVNGQDLYQNYQAHGLAYGPSLQVIDKVYQSHDASVAILELPACVAPTADEFALHPSIMDGAFQSVAGAVEKSNDNALYLPFAIENITIFGPIPSKCFSYVQRSNKRQTPGVKTFNIVLANMAGEVILKIENIYLKSVIDEPSEAAGVH